MRSRDETSGSHAERSDFADVFHAELVAILPDEAVPDLQPRTPNDSDAQVRELIDWVDQRPTPLTALCLSGGGIRSASFALGVLQALARVGVLGHFHYLSTVSGGGYIGSWLSAWRVSERGDDAGFPQPIQRGGLPGGGKHALARPAA